MSTRQLRKIPAGDTGWPRVLVMKGLRPIGKDGVRDKVEHMHEEVNAVS